MIRRVLPLGLSLVTLLANGLAFAADLLTLLPSEIVLTGKEARQRVLVEEVAGSQVIGQVTQGAALVSSNIPVET